ncbi:MAG: hypothetical protein K5883_04345 [Pseudobutyrivibrio sp.]|nr:hypothetical protein [Pseudobutyrivibrio sp.]
MNTKPVPIIITLTAAFISCVVSIIQHVEFSVFVTRLLVVVLVFIIMGTIIKIILDYSFKTLEPAITIDEQMEGVVPDDVTTSEPEEDVDTKEEINSLESEEG